MMDDRPAPLDDHQFAKWVAESAGHELLRLRSDSGLQGKALKDAGDTAAENCISRLLAQHRPDDSVLSEEAADDRSRLEADRVWIIDPLDGTREYSEPPRDDWAVHVALWERGELTAGAVSQPARGATLSTGEPTTTPRPGDGRVRLAVSRTRPSPLVQELAEMIGAELIPMGSAGVKASAVIRGDVDVYLHSGGQFEWDSAAPVAVANAAGLHTSRADGSPLFYNQPDVYLPDLLICRPQMATGIIEHVRSSDHA